MNPPGVAIVKVDATLLRRWPLPQPQPDGDKDARGRVLVIAGSAEMPGAALLAATAAFRVGAGRVTLAVGTSVAQGVALALPECRVIALPESRAGGLLPSGMDRIEPVLRKTQAVLVGPGMQDEQTIRSLVQALLPHCGEMAVVLDALALNAVTLLQRFDSPVLLTPHLGEMAKLRGASKDSLRQDAQHACRQAARQWNAVVALKGARTWIATPQGQAWRHDGGDVGLATSGSGDVLAGLCAGLAARGASLEQAAVWSVALHAGAGSRLAARHGPLGYMARELMAEVPALMHELASAEA